MFKKSMGGWKHAENFHAWNVVAKERGFLDITTVTHQSSEVNSVSLLDSLTDHNSPDDTNKQQEH